MAIAHCHRVLGSGLETLVLFTLKDCGKLTIYLVDKYVFFRLLLSPFQRENKDTPQVLDHTELRGDGENKPHTGRIQCGSSESMLGFVVKSCCKVLPYPWLASLHINGNQSKQRVNHAPQFKR